MFFLLQRRCLKCCTDCMLRILPCDVGRDLIRFSLSNSTLVCQSRDSSAWVYFVSTEVSRYSDSSYPFLSWIQRNRNIRDLSAYWSDATRLCGAFAVCQSCVTMYNNEADNKEAKAFNCVPRGHQNCLKFLPAIDLPLLVGSVRLPIMLTH